MEYLDISHHFLNSLVQMCMEIQNVLYLGKDLQNLATILGVGKKQE